MRNTVSTLPALLPRRRLAALICCLLAGQAYASTTWTVTSAAAGDGVCSDRTKKCTTLKAAITAASNGSDIDQKIVFGSRFSNGGVIEGEFFIESKNNITIDGSPKGVVLMGPSSVEFGAVISNYSTAAISLNRLTLQNGGCGIYSESAGPMTVDNSTISDNECGIASHWGTMTINNSTIARNYVGISIGYGEMTINNSTISDNSNNSTGGGIKNEGGELTINNSTIVRNTAYRGGGIYTTSPITINHSTITDNRTTSDLRGVGLFLNNTAATLRSTVIAGNVGGESSGSPDLYCHAFYYGCAVVSSGHNLIGDGSSTPYLVSNNNGNGDQIGGSGANAIDARFVLDEQLQPLLTDNGGPTQTVALQSDSPAIGGGDCTSSPSVATDQRGYARATPCTIGAFEYGADL